MTLTGGCTCMPHVLSGKGGRERKTGKSGQGGVHKEEGRRGEGREKALFILDS